MSTGYTADVSSGKVTDFKEFAMHCATAFVVAMRDEAIGAKIPELKPSEYRRQALEDAKVELARIQCMTDDECAVLAVDDHRKIVEAYRRADAEKLAVRERLLAMRSRAADWRPPTSEHQALKDFMIQQLSSTIEFDTEPSSSRPEVKKLTGPEWRAEQLESGRRSVAYYAEQWEKEVQRTSSTNLWVSELRKSLASF